MLAVFDYPFDSKKILRKKKSLKRALLNNKNLVDKKVAILGGTTTNEIREQIELFLLKAHIRPKFYECDYGQYYESVIFEDKSLYEFKPDFIYIHISTENLKCLQNQTKPNKEKAKEEFNKLVSIWKKINKYFNCPIIQDNFELPLVRSHGNYDISSDESSINFVLHLNLMINKASEKMNFLNICDRNYLSCKIGLLKWKDYSLWLSTKYSLSYNAITHLSYTVSKIIESLLGRSKKCLVLDLDDTLWGGIIGDDGKEGINLGKDTAIGEAFLEFQQYIKELKNRGIILAICSKNEFDIAKSGFDHPDSILKFSDFTVFKANWEPKSKNIYEIANEINIGIDSLVFIDNNPFERDIVRKEFEGQVCVPEIGDDITTYRDIIDASDLFCITSISSEDKKRNEYYKDNKNRNKYLSTFNNYDDYLKSLNMSAEICSFKKIYLNRITQLINKTNQFNLTTKRMSENEIELSMNDINRISIYARLKDKFGDNGLVSLMQGIILKDELKIEIWLMSCRVFKRTLEHSIFYEFLKKAKEKNIKIIKGIYIPTSKNKIVSNLYEEMGFVLKNKLDGTKTYELNLAEFKIPDNKNINLQVFNEH
ncbi:HAD-IIIC family phosphatase [Candidatus Pelagibacter sp.]|nr:HAD-IIIC family phosphatase [Candidatus Pelagibacter sp.]